MTTSRTATADRSFRRAPGARLPPPKGFALVVVVTMLAVMVILTVEFQYGANVNVASAANTRDDLKAYYLARSAVEFARMTLAIQKVIDEKLRQFNVKGQLQIWREIPMDSNVVCLASSGVFAQQLLSGSMFSDKARDAQSAFGDAQSAAGDSTRRGSSSAPPSPLDRAGIDIDAALAAFAEQKEQAQKDGAATFCSFDGSFYADIQDEGAKINVNIGPTAGPAEWEQLRQSLSALMASPRYDPLFERRDAEGQYVTRDDLVAAIMDWQDPDKERQPWAGGGSEDDRFQMRDGDKYTSKNTWLDSIEELRLVRGMDDRFWDAFGPALTIYPSRINPNTMSVPVLMGLLAQCMPPGALRQMSFEQVRIWIDRIMYQRDQQGGYYDEQQFVGQARAQGTAFVDEACVAQKISLQPQMFTVRGVGEVGTVQRDVTAVVSMDGRLLYWKE